MAVRAITGGVVLRVPRPEPRPRTLRLRRPGDGCRRPVRQRRQPRRFSHRLPALLGPLREIPGQLRLALPLGAGLYGPFDYTIVRWRTLKNGHRQVDLTRWQHPSFIELEHEKTGWRIVAGGW